EKDMCKRYRREYEPPGRSDAGISSICELRAVQNRVDMVSSRNARDRRRFVITADIQRPSKPPVQVLRHRQLPAVHVHVVMARSINERRRPGNEILSNVGSLERVTAKHFPRRCFLRKARWGQQ